MAASGGPDSVALLHMLVNFLPDPSEQLIVAHLDHCLRSDSYLESELLNKLAVTFDIKLVEKNGQMSYILKQVLKRKLENIDIHF